MTNKTATNPNKIFSPGPLYYFVGAVIVDKSDRYFVNNRRTIYAMFSLAYGLNATGSLFRQHCYTIKRQRKALIRLRFAYRRSRAIGFLSTISLYAANHNK